MWHGIQVVQSFTFCANCSFKQNCLVHTCIQLLLLIHYCNWMQVYIHVLTNLHNIFDAFLGEKHNQTHHGSLQDQSIQLHFTVVVPSNTPTGNQSHPITEAVPLNTPTGSQSHPITAAVPRSIKHTHRQPVSSNHSSRSIKHTHRQPTSTAHSPIAQSTGLTSRSVKTCKH